NMERMAFREREGGPRNEAPPSLDPYLFRSHQHRRCSLAAILLEEAEGRRRQRRYEFHLRSESLQKDHLSLLTKAGHLRIGYTRQRGLSIRQSATLGRSHRSLAIGHQGCSALGSL